MFNNIDELKQFIQWAKENRVKKAKIKDIEIELSDLAYLDNLDPATGSSLATDLSQSQIPEETDEDLLFYSSQTS